MSRILPPRRPEPASPAVQWVGWGVYATLALLGFCFGVWAGTQRPKPAEVTRTERPDASPALKPAENAEPTPAAKPAESKKAEPAPKLPEPKPPEPRKPEPKKADPLPVAAVSFRDVLPVFRSKCLTCHGDPKIEEGVDLRTLASTLKGGKNGEVIVPGNLDKSVLWITVEEGAMPPPGKEKLTDTEKKLIRDWIRGGAK
jgi:mono/diheme cytochrome c family protein